MAQSVGPRPPCGPNSRRRLPTLRTYCTILERACGGQILLSFSLAGGCETLDKQGIAPDRITELAPNTVLEKRVILWKEDRIDVTLSYILI